MTNTPLPLVAFTGKRGHGKTTAAEALIEQYGYVHLNFADPLREVCARVYGVSMEEMLSPDLKEKVLDRWPFKAPRELLQQIGTDMFRSFIDDTWVQAFKNEALRLIAAGAPGVVCSDCRFLNEAAMVRELGGVLIKIEDPRKPQSDAFSQHKSETEIDLLPVHWTIYNERSIADLRSAALMIADAPAAVNAPIAPVLVEAA